MKSVRATDWNPASEEVLRDQRSAFDAMRESCPVAWSEQLQWSLFRHEDVVRALEDHETFSNGVSKHLSVPNGMDPPEHTQYRTIIEPYFAPAPMKAFAGICRRIADELVAGIGPGDVELMERLALPFARAGPVRVPRLAAGTASPACRLDSTQPRGDAGPGSDGTFRSGERVRSDH